MTAFRSRWDDWEPKEAPIRTDKADKSPSVSFGSASPKRFDETKEASVSSVSAPPSPFLDGNAPSNRETGAFPSIEGPRETLSPRTDITDKSLPQAFNLTTDKADERSQPACVVLLAVPPGVPEAWVQGVADLLALSCPASYPAERWEALREDAYHFLRDHAARAHVLGWAALDLFGVHPVKPWARLDVMGLVPLLRGRRITALSESRAELRDHGGGELTYRRARTPCPSEACLVWELAK